MYKWHSGYMRKQNADIRKMLWEDRQYKKMTNFVISEQ